MLLLHGAILLVIHYRGVQTTVAMVTVTWTHVSGPGLCELLIFTFTLPILWRGTLNAQSGWERVPCHTARGFPSFGPAIFRVSNFKQVSSTIACFRQFCLCLSKLGTFFRRGGAYHRRTRCSFKNVCHNAQCAVTPGKGGHSPSVRE